MSRLSPLPFKFPVDFTASVSYMPRALDISYQTLWPTFLLSLKGQRRFFPSALVVLDFVVQLIYCQILPKNSSLLRTIWFQLSSCKVVEIHLSEQKTWVWWFVWLTSCWINPDRCRGITWSPIRRVAEDRESWRTVVKHQDTGSNPDTVATTNTWK